jgi:hypothetical protein
MESAEIIEECWLRSEEIKTLLHISDSTLYRWKRSGLIPRAPWLVLRSVAQGLPVLASRSHQWAGHRFGPDGALYRPNGYPIYPGDLWVFEFLNINGAIGKARKQVEAYEYPAGS